MPGQRKSALKGPRYFVSPEVQGSVCCKQAAIHCNGWRSSSASGWYSGVVEDGTRRLVDGSVQLCVRFIALVAKLELSANANPSFFKSVFVPILTGDYESSKDWKNTIPWPSESGSDGFLRWVHGVTLRSKVHSCEIRVKPWILSMGWYSHLSSELRDPSSHWFGHMSRMSQERLTRQLLLVTSAGKRSRSRPRTRWSDYISNLAWSSLRVA